MDMHGFTLVYIYTVQSTATQSTVQPRPALLNSDLEQQARTAISSARAALEQAGAGHFDRQVAPVQHLHVFLRVCRPEQRKPQKPEMPVRARQTRPRTFVYLLLRTR